MQGSSVHITVIVLIICASAIIDTSIIPISRSTGGLSGSAINVGFFTYMVILFGYGQYVLLHYVGRKKSESQDRVIFYKIKLSLLERFVTIIQYILITILVILILQIMLYQRLPTNSFEICNFYYYISSGIVLALLAFRLTTWLKVNRNMVGLLYSLAIAILAVNSFFAFIYLNIGV